MITGSAEYQEYLKLLADSYNPPNILIRIPVNEPVYEINLETRAASAPKFLGVEADNNAEIIYFKVDRYYDSVDLAQCLCGIQIRNARAEEYIYVVPAYDILSLPGKIIFPWEIQSPVTKYSGNVEFSIKFFKIDKTSGELLYELNTVVTKTKVLIGWASKNGVQHDYRKYTVDKILSSPGIEPVIDENGNPVLDADGNPTYTVTGYSIWSKIQEIFDANKKFNVYWLDV